MIFARALPDGRQALAYRMSMAAAEDLAMVLPLPTPPGAPEDAVRFVDLSGYPELFRDLDRALPAYALPRGRGSASGVAPQPASLPVQAVGDFEASFVPTLADFSRLDPRFRLPDGVWDQLPGYADYGFAVFKLRSPGGWLRRLWRRGAEGRHPMALTFPSRSPERLFFPTVHVHDGEVHPRPRFDHSLFWQAPDETGGDASGVEDVRAPPQVVASSVRIDATQGLLSSEQPLFRRVLKGEHENADVWIDA